MPCVPGPSRAGAFVAVLACGCTQIGGPYDGDDMSPNTEAYEASAGTGDATVATDASATTPTSTDPGTTGVPMTGDTTIATDTPTTTDPSTTGASDPSTTTDPTTTDASTSAASDPSTTTGDPTSGGSTGGTTGTT